MKKLFMVMIMTIVAIGGFFAGKVEITDGTKEVIAAETKAEAPEEGSLEFYQQLLEDNPQIEIVDSSQLTYEDIVSRNGKLLVEKVIGRVVNEAGDGEVLNCQDPDYNYISYKGHMEEYKVGDVIVSYMIYNPDTLYEDDIMERFDYIIDRTETELH